MVKVGFTLFILFFTTVLIGQDCTSYCTKIKLNKNYEIIDPEHILACQCINTIAQKLDSFFSVAVQQEDLIAQKLILNQLESLLISKQNDLIKETSYLSYLFNKGLYNKHINNLEFAESKFNEIVLSLTDNYKENNTRAELLSLSLQQLAEIATSKSNFQKSNDLLQYSIDLEKKRVEGTNEMPRLHSMHNRIGLNYSLMGNAEEALSYFRLGNEPMKAAIENLSEKRLQSLAYIFIGYFSLELKETLNLKKNNESLEILKIISKIQQPAHPRNKAINLLWAKYYTNANQQDSAAFYFKKSRDSIFNSINNTSDKLNYYINYADYCEEFVGEEASLLALDSAVIYGDELLSTSTKWSRNMILAKSKKINLLHRMGRQKEALGLISLFSKEINQQLNGVVIFEDHINHINDFYPIFEIGLEIIENNFPAKTDLAFDIIECMKSVSLYKASLLTNNTKFSSQDSLLLKFKTLNALSNQYTTNQLRGDSSLENKNKLYDTNEELAKIKSQLIAENPRQNILNLQKYQENIVNKKTHILTFAGNQRYYFLKIDDKSAKLLSIDKPELEAILRKYFASISNFSDNSYIDIARQLGTILKPLFHNVDSDIVFSGDGYLDLIPLESIIGEDDDFLLSKYCISYTPSARIQHLFSNRNLPKSIKTAIFRPDFNSGDIPLEYAEKECAAVKRIMNGKVFENDYANKDVFLSQSEHFDILHLATHAKSINEDPAQSYISFTDSKLYFNEIKSMLLNTELVCLAACETNVGQNFNGEGIQSLARNFIASGARSVISSLWKISDQATSEITVSFYEYMKKGFSKSQALQKAKIDFIKKHPDDGKHPYFWAGLILTGNADHIQETSFWKYALGFILLTIAALAFYKFILKSN